MPSNNTDIINAIGFTVDHTVVDIIVDDITAKLAALTPLLSGGKVGFDGKVRYTTEANRICRAILLAKQLRHRFLAIEQLLEAQQKLTTYLTNPLVEAVS